jgi:hypothetical protein
LNNNNKSDLSMDPDRTNILTLLDSFIERIDKIRKFLIGVSISSVILTPIAISLAIFLFSHPSFFRILESESDFGLGLAVLLSSVIIISSILFVTGILQFRQIGSWHKKYKLFKKDKDDLNKYIAKKFKMEIDDVDGKEQQS